MKHKYLASQHQLKTPKDKSYIYESPDGGRTVYRRAMGDLPCQRQLHHSDKQKQSLHQNLMESKLWGDIHRKSQQDPALKTMLDQIQVYYQLKYVTE